MADDNFAALDDEIGRTAGNAFGFVQGAYVVFEGA